MAQRTANTTTQAAAQQLAERTAGQTAGFTMTGILKKVYVGKKYCYATITVNTGGKYYDQFEVKFDLTTDFPDDGTKVNVCGIMHTFKAEVNFTGTMISAV